MASGKNSLSSRREAKVAQRAYYDEEDDEDERDGPSAGLREVAINRKTLSSKPSTGAAHKHDGEDESHKLPLRLAKHALHQAYQAALAKHANALEFIDNKIARATRQGFFTIKFTFGEVDGLGAASHDEYVAFINLLDIMGYNAKYQNVAEDGHKHAKQVFEPATIIYLDFLPRKK